MHKVISDYLIKILGEEAQRDWEKLGNVNFPLDQIRAVQGHLNGLIDSGPLIERALKEFFEGYKETKEDINGRIEKEEDEWDSSSLS